MYDTDDTTAHEPTEKRSLRFATDLEADVSLTDWTALRVHRVIFDETESQFALLEALQTAADGVDILEFEHRLSSCGFDVDGSVVKLARRAVAGERRALWDLIRYARRLGHDEMGQPQSALEDALAFTRLLGYSNPQQTIAIGLNAAFRETRRDQADEIIEYVLTLSESVDVVLGGSEIDRVYLHNYYGDILPSSVTNPCNDTRNDYSITTLVDVVGTDGLAVEILRTVGETESGHMAYSALQSAFSQYDRTTVSRRLNEKLIEYGLCEKYGARGNLRIEILDKGALYLEELAKEKERQKALQDYVTNTPKPNHNTRVITDRPRGGREDDHRPTAEGEASTTPDGRVRLPRYHGVDYLSYAETVSAAKTPPKKGVSVTNYPVEPKSDRGEAGWGYLEDENTLVVSAEYDSAMSHVVMIARALLDPKTFDQVLTEDRLAELDGLIEDGTYVRGSRNLGWLADSVDSAGEYVDVLEDARDELLDMTRSLAHEDYECETSEYLSRITKTAMGLAGTAFHVLDLLDIDVVWEARLPDYNRHPERYGEDNAELLATTLAKNAPIAATYGNHVVRRLLFEDRDEKRRQSFDPVVDASNPYANLIASISVVGDFGNRADHVAGVIEDRLSNPGEIHEDAPEIALKVPVVVEHGPSTVARVTRAMCRAKGLDATRDAIRLFSGFARTPYDVAHAIGRGLSQEATPREIRSSEVRLSLASLPSKRLLEDATPTVRAMISTLLATNLSLSKTELAEKAGISTQSVRNHLPTLVAMGLVDETEGQCRLNLSFTDEQERHKRILPSFMLTESFTRDVLFETLEALDELTEEVIEIWVQCGPNGLPDIDRLHTMYDWVDWVRPLLSSLTEERDETVQTLSIGPEIAQQPLTEAGS